MGNLDAPLLGLAWNENDGRCWCRESPDDGPGRVTPHEERCLTIRSLLNPEVSQAGRKP